MNIGEYKNTTNYPERPKKPVIPKDFKPTDSEGMASKAQAWGKYGKELEAYDVSMLVYKQKLDAYHNGESSMIAKFKTDALEELGLGNHPKADVLFGKAWEHGHASGLSEVWNWMQDLAELLQ